MEFLMVGPKCHSPYLLDVALVFVVMQWIEVDYQTLLAQ
jgi:hypothetical protein